MKEKMKEFYQALEKICGNKYFVLLFLPISVGFLLLYSYSTSPLYINDAVDSAVFKTMGLAILQGKIPYVDIFDHKGPIIYFIQALGQWLIPGRVGIFCLQVIALFVTLLYLFKTSKLFLNNTLSFVTLLVTLYIYSGIICEGNKCESWMLLFFAISTYHILKYIIQSPAQPHPLSYSLIYGLCFGLAFFIRPNDAFAQFAGIMGGLVIYLFYNKHYKNAMYNIGMFLVGFIIVAIPIFGYFIYHNALGEFWYGLIGFNMTYSGGIFKLIRSMFSTPKLVHVLFFTAMWGMLYKTEYKQVLWITIPLIILQLTFMGTFHVGFIYYYVVLVPMFMLYIIALFLTKDRVLLIICAFILFFLPQFEKRPILKVAKGTTISNIKVLASGEPSAKKFYKEVESLLSHIPSTERDSIWNYNLFWAVPSEDYENNRCGASMLACFPILWNNGIVQCNRITCGQSDELHQKDNIADYNPLWVIKVHIKDRKDPREKSDHILYERYDLVAKTDSTICNIDLYKRKENVN